jgi:hypothetical protein
MYVSTELYPVYQTTDPRWGMLRARSHTVGLWEKFLIGCGEWDCYIYSVANRLYVSAELGYPKDDPRYGMLRARNTYWGPWEKFTRAI